MVKMKSTKTTFVNDKFSKIIHFKLNNEQIKDIVFIGSSRTLYHISTNIFKKNNINIYNFGVSGLHFQDYPSLISHINDSHPKQIIMSFWVTNLFKDLGVAAFPSLEEVRYYYDIDKIKFLQSLNTWIINKHLFLKYSEPIFYKIKSIYEKFEHNNHTSKKIVSNNKQILNSKKVLIDKSINYSQVADCNVVDIKKIEKGNKSQLNLKCTNGDGFIVGHYLTKTESNVKQLTNINQQSAEYIQKLINSIDITKTKVSIILQPMIHSKYTYNLNEIKNKFQNVEIIDLTKLNIKDAFWSDDTHLNYKGREYYSNYLLNAIYKNKINK